MVGSTSESSLMRLSAAANSSSGDEPASTTGRGSSAESSEGSSSNRVSSGPERRPRASVANRGSTSTSSGLTISDWAGLSVWPAATMRDVPPSNEGRYVMRARAHRWRFGRCSGCRVGEPVVPGTAKCLANPHGSVGVRIPYGPSRAPWLSGFGLAERVSRVGGVANARVVHTPVHTSKGRVRTSPFRGASLAREAHLPTAAYPGIERRQSCGGRAAALPGATTQEGRSPGGDSEASVTRRRGKMQSLPSAERRKG